MNELLSFLRDICENPADDLPRMVYADCLDEQAEYFGELRFAMRARAELIRLQIEIARGPDCPVCRKVGRFRGKHREWCRHFQINPLSTDIPADKEVDNVCPCGYYDKHNRVKFLLNSKYPIAAKDSKLRLPGKELWKPHSLMTAREVLYTRGFVGIVSTTCLLFLDHCHKAVRETPVEKFVLCDRVIPRNLPVYGKFGFVFASGAQTEYLKRICPVIPEELFNLVVELRDADRARDEADAYKWLIWASTLYARRKCGMSDYCSRPADAPYFAPLKPGNPTTYFDASGNPRDFQADTLSMDAVDAIYRGDKEMVDYKGIYQYEQGPGTVPGIPV